MDPTAAAELRAAFEAATATAWRHAVWPMGGPKGDPPPNTCPFCGRFRQAWSGSKLAGHAACIVPREFKLRVAELLRSPAMTYAQVAVMLGVTSGVVRSWAFAAGIAGPAHAVDLEIRGVACETCDDPTCSYCGRAAPPGDSRAQP